MYKSLKLCFKTNNTVFKDFPAGTNNIYIFAYKMCFTLETTFCFKFNVFSYELFKYAD